MSETTQQPPQQPAEPIELSPRFTGTNGRNYELRFDVEACRRAKAQCGVKVTDIWLGTLAVRIKTEPELAVDLAFIACASVDDPVQFAKLVGVDRLPDVQEAVIDALISFSCALTRNQTPAKVARAQLQSFANMMELADAKAVPATPEDLAPLAERLAASLNPSSGRRSTSTPASSASTPPDSPGESST